MKKGRNNSTNFGCQVLLTVFVVVLTFLNNPASCHALETAILLRQSPTEGGTINLGEGVHQFEQYTEVTLTAVPKTGWQFVCWLGEVSDATTPTTTAFIDSPKIIIAVFTRVAYEFLVGEPGATSSPNQYLIPTAPTPYTGIEEAESKYPTPPSPPTPPTPPTPTPFPVPAPEPATVVLLAIGSICAFRKCTANRHSGKVNSG
jgi:hypothetical protein